MDTQERAVRAETSLCGNGTIAEVYEELRALAAAYVARESCRQNPTSLVHDALLRIGDLAVFESRVELFAAVAQTIRRTLIDRARQRHTLKRGARWHRVALDPSHIPATSVGVSLLELDELLTRLGEQDSRAARVVELRFFSGLGLEQTARVLGVSRKTVVGDWAFARAWLSRHFTE